MTDDELIKQWLATNKPITQRPKGMKPVVTVKRPKPKKRKKSKHAYENKDHYQWSGGASIYANGRGRFNRGHGALS